MPGLNHLRETGERIEAKYTMTERKITAGKPWRCLNCKTPLTAEQKTCKCGDRVGR